LRLRGLRTMLAVFGDIAVVALLIVAIFAVERLAARLGY